MKRILIPTLLAIGSAYLGAGALQAQTQEMYAKVPFAFQAAGADHQPGTYSIRVMSNPQAVLMQNTKERNTSVLGIADQHDETKGNPRLVFHRYGNQFFLSEVWGREKLARKLPPSRLERELRANETRTEAAVVNVECLPTRGL